MIFVEIKLLKRTAPVKMFCRCGGFDGRRWLRRVVQWLGRRSGSGCGIDWRLRRWLRGSLLLQKLSRVAINGVFQLIPFFLKTNSESFQLCWGVVQRSFGSRSGSFGNRSGVMPGLREVCLGVVRGLFEVRLWVI